MLVLLKYYSFDEYCWFLFVDVCFRDFRVPSCHNNQSKIISVLFVRRMGKNL